MDCVIPDVLKRVPLALSYQTFIHFYWPGALMCCNRKYTSSRCYGLHFYKRHVPPLSSPDLSILPTVNTTKHSPAKKKPADGSDREAETNYNSFHEKSPVKSPKFKRSGAAPKKKRATSLNHMSNSTMDAIGTDTTLKSSTVQRKKRPLSIHTFLTDLIINIK